MVTTGETAQVDLGEAVEVGDKTWRRAKGVTLQELYSFDFDAACVV